MSVIGAAVGAVLGLLAGCGGWWWLHTGGHRVDGDAPRLPLTRAWAVIPAAGVAGAVAGLGGQTATTPALWLVLVVGVVISWVDLDVHRVPDQLLRPLAGAVLFSIAGPAVLTGRWSVLTGAALGGLAVGAVFFALALFSSMGLGDVKLGAVLGFVLGTLGWGTVLTGVVAAYVLAAAAGVVLLARGHGRNTHLPFGPALVTGAGVAAVLAAAAA